MALKIISGDFKNEGLFSWGISPAKKGVKVPKTGLRRLASLGNFEVIGIQGIQVLLETENSKTTSNPFGGCFLGLALNLFLPFYGFLIGLIAGRNSHTTKTKEITFSCQLKDGRSFVAICDAATYQRFLAASHRQR